jgi:hypothetical protein
MAKCSHCDYPYATSGNCPNCGSDNPGGWQEKIYGYVGLVILFVIIFKACS